MLGKSHWFVMDKAKRAGLLNGMVRNQRWEFTEDDLQKIKAITVKRKRRINIIADETGLTTPMVRRIAHHCGLRLIRDYDKVLWACQKYATGFYTKEGIFYLLKTEYGPKDRPVFTNTSEKL